jgi:hypothetical protein
MTAPSPNSLQEGDFAYVDFNEVGEPWHEFQIGGHAGGANYVVRSPDNDEWVQELALSDDIRGLRLGSRFVLPPGLGGHVGTPVCRFTRKPTVTETAEFIARCPAIITAWIAEQSATGLVPVVTPISMQPRRAPPICTSQPAAALILPKPSILPIADARVVLAFSTLAGWAAPCATTCRAAVGGGGSAGAGI